ncbi:hypothetical protein C8Q76DRAFT_605300, partial [Earliella scabrosa]
EEVIMRVQGYLVDLSLPPVQQHQIPRNANRVVDLKQTVTLSGLGAERFDCAVRGISTIYQMFKSRLLRSNSHLRDWFPGQDGYHATLTFSNRYVTPLKDAGGEQSLDLRDVVDPFNLMGPLLRNHIHMQENAVEYWKQNCENVSDAEPAFERIKPETFALGHLVEVQVAFQVARIGQAEYVFLPKLRALCLLDRTAEKVSHLSNSLHAAC